MDTSVADVLYQLAVEKLDTRLFRGMPNDWPNKHVFGGHIVAQAMEAADLTVLDSYKVHSLHSYFLRPGIAGQHVIYDVDPIREGASFCTRRVVATQNGEAIFTASISYHKGEAGVSHQVDMADVPQPEDLSKDEDYYEKVRARQGLSNSPRPVLPFDLRSIDRMDFENPQPKSSVTGYWLKLKDKLPKESAHARHAALLAYCSDFNFMSSNLRPHALIGRSERVKMMASLDHSIWFHSQDYAVDDWIYFQTDGQWADEGRCFARGSLYTRDGRMIASAAQEALVRLNRKSEANKHLYAQD